MRTNCEDCGIEFDILNSVYQTGYRLSRCRECFRKYRNIYRKKYGQKNKEHIRNQNYKTAYGISIEDYNKLLEFQQNGCAICKQTCKSGQKLSIDHNHENNEIRGLLCKTCNIAIGHFNEDENLFLNAIEYLKRTTWNKKIA